MPRALDQLELGLGRWVAAPLFRALDAIAPSVLERASWEPDTHVGASFARDAASWRRNLFLLKMLGTYGLHRGDAIAALRRRLDDPAAPPSTTEGDEAIFLGDLLAVDGLGAGTLAPGLRARLARAQRLVINLEGTVAEETHSIAPLLTRRGLAQMASWSSAQDGSVWASRLGLRDLRALLEGLPPIAFSVANNHTFDAGPAGFARTLAALRDLGVEAVGATGPGDDGGVVVAVGETSVGLLAAGFGANQPAGAAGRTLDFSSVPYGLPLDRVRREVARLLDLGATYLVALLHWGYEYEHLPRADMVACVEELWSLGVHAVIGHHPHLVQPCAGSGRRFAAFSLGDFVGGDRTVFSRFGCAVSVRLPRPGDASSPAVELIPLVQAPHHARTHRTSLLEESSAEDRALWDALHAAKVGRWST